jgi:hypothetical protein
MYINKETVTEDRERSIEAAMVWGGGGWRGLRLLFAA